MSEDTSRKNTQTKVGKVEKVKNLISVIKKAKERQ